MPPSVPSLPGLKFSVGGLVRWKNPLAAFSSANSIQISSRCRPSRISLSQSRMGVSRGSMPRFARSSMSFFISARSSGVFVGNRRASECTGQWVFMVIVLRCEKKTVYRGHTKQCPGLCGWNGGQEAGVPVAQA